MLRCCEGKNELCNKLLTVQTSLTYFFIYLRWNVFSSATSSCAFLFPQQLPLRNLCRSLLPSNPECSACSTWHFGFWCPPSWHWYPKNFSRGSWQILSLRKHLTSRIEKGTGTISTKWLHWQWGIITKQKTIETKNLESKIIHSHFISQIGNSYSWLATCHLNAFLAEQHLALLSFGKFEIFMSIHTCLPPLIKVSKEGIS